MALFTQRPKTLGERISQVVPKLPGQESAQDKRIHMIQQGLLYLAIFVAGYMTATILRLLSLVP